jgi:hypothetical protein
MFQFPFGFLFEHNFRSTKSAHGQCWLSFPPVDGAFVRSGMTLAPVSQLFNKLDDLDDAQAPRSRDSSGGLQRSEPSIRIEAQAAPDASTRWANTAQRPHTMPFPRCAGSDPIANIIAIFKDSQRSSLATC